MELLTIRDVLALIKVSRATLSRLLEAGLPSFGTGRLRRFEREAVLRWLVGHRRGAQAAPPPGGLYHCNRCRGWWVSPNQIQCVCGGVRQLDDTLRGRARQS